MSSLKSGKLSKTLQAETLDLTVISDLVESTLHSLDDAMLPAANWVLGLLDSQADLEEATDTKRYYSGYQFFPGSNS